MNEFPILFQKDGFPEICLFENCFTVKSNETGRVKEFNYSKIKEVSVMDSKDSSNILLNLPIVQILTDLTGQTGPIKLLILSVTNTPWEYEIPNGNDDELNDLINFINRKSS